MTEEIVMRRADGTIVGEPPAEIVEETPVVFRKYRTWPDKDAGEILALFPADDEGQYRIGCYQHVGQHGSVDYTSCIQATRKATPEEYAPLKAELEQIGYKLKVYEKAAHLLPWRNRR
jgi:hypothetical protein